MRFTGTRIVLMLSAAAAVASMALADSQHVIAEPSTLTIQELRYETDGSVASSLVARRTWRRDGSWALDTLSSVSSTGQTNHTRVVHDVAGRRKTTVYYDLGLRLVHPMSDEAVHASHMNTADCATLAEKAGTAVDGDPLLREQLKEDALLTRRFEPELGCTAVEYTLTRNGEPITERKIVQRDQGTDESLFTIDPSIVATSRGSFFDAYENMYGRPFIGNAAVTANQRAMDVTHPLLDLD